MPVGVAPSPVRNVQVAQGGSGPLLPTRLIGPSDLVYTGSFRLPSGFQSAFNLLAYRPLTGTLFIGSQNKVAEINIPPPVISGSVANLTRAVQLQPLSDVLQGKDGLVDGGTSTLVQGGLLVDRSRLLATIYRYYDGNGTQSVSHFVTGLDFAHLPTVLGPLQVTTPVRTPGAGFVSAYFAPIPTEWQTALGGDTLNGNCCKPIVSRTSFGPSVSVIRAADIGTVDPAASHPLVAYPENHTTLGPYGPNHSTTWYNGEMDVAGVIFVPQTASVVFMGRRGSEFCYGTGTNDPALAFQPMPGFPGEIYCYDPTNSNKGDHGYPYETFVAVYDANDFAAVVAGTRNYWEPIPKRTWALTLPFETNAKELTAITLDPATNRLFIAVPNVDGFNPLVHVYRVI